MIRLQNLKKYIFITSDICRLPAVVTVAAAPVVLGAVGFTSAGIAAGSVAANMMSAAAVANGGGVAAGSVVAVLQSAGKTEKRGHISRPVLRLGDEETQLTENTSGIRVSIVAKAGVDFRGAFFSVVLSLLNFIDTLFCCLRCSRTVSWCQRSVGRCWRCSRMAH